MNAIYKNLMINAFNGLNKFNDTRPLPSPPPAPTPPEILTFSLQQCCGAEAVILASWSRSWAETGLQNKWINLEW